MQQSRMRTAHSQTHRTSPSKLCAKPGSTQSSWSRKCSNSSPTTDTNDINVTDTDTSKQMQNDSVSETAVSGQIHEQGVELDTMSDRHLPFFEDWIEKFWQTYPVQVRENFEATASTQPPISASSLRELEIGYIMNNVKLRQDINFDRELHFRPNLEGERGREKISKSVNYWKALETELQLYNYLLADPAGSNFIWTTEWITTFRQSQRRIPKMFETIKEILTRLMPEQDQERLKETLDVVLIMQQIERGLFDLEKLAVWFAQLLKSHCAPMRDPLVDQMVEKTSNGAGIMDAVSVVEGLKELFGILEAMKLDVANHQIRYLRVMLLDNTVAFEQNYYRNKIENKQIDTENALAWYLQKPQLFSESRKDSSLRQDFLAPFVSALVTSLLPPYRADIKARFPETFKLDMDRLRVLNSDAHGLIYHLICYEALEHIINYLKCSRENADFAKANVGDVVRSVVGFPPYIDTRWIGKHGNIALELVRLASRGSNFQSSDFATELQHDEKLIAACDKAERWLQYNLKPTSDLFMHQIMLLQQTMFNRILSTMESNIGRSSVAAFEAFVAHPRSQLTGPELYELVLHDIIRRLTHIGLLHWQVWGALVYAKDSPDATLTQSETASLQALPRTKSSHVQLMNDQEKEQIIHSKTVE